jgi:hypothetical protein
MMPEVETWIEGTLASQRADGDFGPDQRFEDGTRDYWANMVMLFCLQSYHERTNDPRVLELMTRYFKYQLTVPDDKMLTHYWQKMRGGDNLQHPLALQPHRRSGAAQVAEKIHRCTADWNHEGRPAELAQRQHRRVFPRAGAVLSAVARRVRPARRL